jgi:hypothetical protein
VYRLPADTVDKFFLKIAFLTIKRNFLLKIK